MISMYCKTLYQKFQEVISRILILLGHLDCDICPSLFCAKFFMQQKSSRFLYWPSTVRQVHCEKFTITSVYPPLILNYCSKIHFRWQQRIMLDNFLPNLFFFINWEFRLKCTTDKCRIIGKWDKCIFAWIHPLTEDTSTMSLDCCIQQFKLVMTSNPKCVFFLFKMKCKILDGRGYVLRKHKSAVKLFILSLKSRPTCIAICSLWR